MEWDFHTLLNWFSTAGRSSLLLKGKWGLEKESHRVTRDGKLSNTDHPAVFGDKLSNAKITTDFSESQLELVTSPKPSVEEVWSELQEIHDEVDSGIGEEWLWPMSMPPMLPSEDKIKIAKYNRSNKGRAQENYRIELARRYGKKMQMISGLHYNFAFHSDLLDHLYSEWGQDDKLSFINELYVSLTRNFLRNRWLLIYLFGASPSADPTFDSVIQGEIKKIEECCSGSFLDQFKHERQYVTSLRASRFGYSNTAQSEYPVLFNSLDDYVRDISTLLTTPCQKYERMGLENPNVLQNENEFYSSIRLKRNVPDGESHLNILQKKGVEYVEIRIMDLNPFARVGIDLQQLKFLHVFIISCLIESSPLISEEEFKTINNNHHRVSLFGRKPDLNLERFPGEYVPMDQLLEERFDLLFKIAVLLDHSEKNGDYQRVVANEYKKVKERHLLPSAIIQQEMNTNGETFLQFGMRMAMKNKNLTLSGRTS